VGIPSLHMLEQKSFLSWGIGVLSGNTIKASSETTWMSCWLFSLQVIQKNHFAHVIGLEKGLVYFPSAHHFILLIILSCSSFYLAHHFIFLIMLFPLLIFEVIYSFCIHVIEYSLLFSIKQQGILSLKYHIYLKLKG